MKKHIPVEFLFQIFALILSIIMVHAIYVSIVRPSAEIIVAEDQMLLQENPDYVARRSVWVLIKDYEQEACFVLGLWALALMGFKAWEGMRERKLLQSDLIPVSEGMSILPEDTREYARPIQALPEMIQNLLLPRALLTALHRFRSTRNIQDVSSAVRTVSDSESDRLDSELSMVRYIAWAIPSIGFIGTVRGIGQALAQAHKAVEGDIAGVTASLGVAFNSTFIALLISIVIMFFVHQLQQTQERLVLDTQTYIDRRLIRHLHIR